MCTEEGGSALHPASSRRDCASAQGSVNDLTHNNGLFKWPHPYVYFTRYSPGNSRPYHSSIKPNPPSLEGTNGRSLRGCQGMMPLLLMEYSIWGVWRITSAQMKTFIVAQCWASFARCANLSCTSSICYVVKGSPRLPRRAGCRVANNQEWAWRGV